MYHKQCLVKYLIAENTYQEYISIIFFILNNYDKNLKNIHMTVPYVYYSHWCTSIEMKRLYLFKKKKCLLCNFT